MYHRISVERNEPDANRRVTYSFIILDALELALDEVVHYERLTKRHGWKCVAKWSRLWPRETTMPKPEIPADVQLEIINQVKDSIKIVNS